MIQRWRVFAFGRLADLLPAGSPDSGFYIVALVADDGSENDQDPGTDGGVVSGVPNPGSGVLLVRGEAFGPAGAYRRVEATIARIGTPESGGTGLRMLSWRPTR